MYSFVVYSYVNGSGSITSVVEERANLSAVVTCNYVVSVWKGFLFLWVLGMGYVILLWHSLSLPYNYFASCIKYSKRGISEVGALSYKSKRIFSNSFDIYFWAEIYP